VKRVANGVLVSITKDMSQSRVKQALVKLKFLPRVPRPWSVIEVESQSRVKQALVKRGFESRSGHHLFACRNPALSRR